MPCVEGDTDLARLKDLNMKIASWEQVRDADAIQCLDSYLSDHLIFRRADRTVVDKKSFMQGLREASPFTSRESDDVAVTQMSSRALVTLTVLTTKPDGAKGRFRNIRVFFKNADRWQLEVWFNDDL